MVAASVASSLLYAASVASYLQGEAWPDRPHEILDPHTGLTVLPVGSNGATHIEGAESSLQLATSSAAGIPRLYTN